MFEIITKGVDPREILAADRAAGGNKTYIGYMRRYTSALVDAVEVVGTIDNIHYAHVRDIIGPNHVFLGQSGTFPRIFKDFGKEDFRALRDKTESDVKYALEVEVGVPFTEQTRMM